MPAENSQQLIFVQWLNHVLQDERWRTYVAAQLRQHELPVIELTQFPPVYQKVCHPQ